MRLPFARRASRAGASIPASAPDGPGAGSPSPDPTPRAPAPPEPGPLVPDGAPDVARRFHAPARLVFDEPIAEEALLTPWQRDPHVDVSGVSIVERRDLRLWTDIRSMCVHDGAGGPDPSLSLSHGGLDYARAVRTPLDRLPGTTAILPHLDPHNYYHWLIDTLPCLGVFGLDGRPLDRIDRFYVHRTGEGFQREALARLGVGPERIVSFDGGDHHYELERALVPLFRLDGGAWPHPWALSWLKATFLGAGDGPGAGEGGGPGAGDRAPGAAAPKPLYVRRGRARRAVANEAALECRLVELGFEVLDPATCCLEAQARAFARADGVLGAHGAGLANVAFCRPGTRVMEFAGRYVTTHFRILARLGGLRYRAIPAGVDTRGERLPTGHGAEHRDADFACDVDAIARAAADWFDLPPQRNAT